MVYTVDSTDTKFINLSPLITVANLHRRLLKLEWSSQKNELNAFLSHYIMLMMLIVISSGNES